MSGAGALDLCGHDEILPHYYGMHKKEPFGRDAESLHGETHASDRTDAQPIVSGRLGRTRMDGEQLRRDAGVAIIRGTAAAILGVYHDPFSHRAGDCPWASVGEEEAGVVTGSGKRKTCQTPSLSLTDSSGSGL